MGMTWRCCGRGAAGLLGGNARAAAGARAGVDGPAALAVEREDEVVEGHERGPVADRHARAPQLLHALAEAVLHVHLRSRAGLLNICGLCC